jgi:tRNA G46 methylase TrmB
MCNIGHHKSLLVKRSAAVNLAASSCRYYGYRLSDAFDEDPRLQALDASWFAGKSVLDIGCNEGVLTLSLACKFVTKSMLGVDIDAVLIGKASKALGSLRGQLAAQLRAVTAGVGCACVSRSSSLFLSCMHARHSASHVHVQQHLPW